jgi:hypothetical protein
VVGLETDHRQVRLGIGAKDLTPVLALVGQLHRDLVSALDDVEVGEDEAAPVEDHARAQAGTAELRAARSLWAEELLEEFLEERIVSARLRTRRATRAGLLDGAQVDHGGAHMLGDACEARVQALGLGSCRGRPRGGSGPLTCNRENAAQNPPTAGRKGHQQCDQSSG